MRALTEVQTQEMAKVLAHPLDMAHSLCPEEIGLENDSKCKGGDWSTACEDCWKSALPCVRILEDGEQG